MKDAENLRKNVNKANLKLKAFSPHNPWVTF